MSTPTHIDMLRANHEVKPDGSRGFSYESELEAYLSWLLTGQCSIESLKLSLEERHNDMKSNSLETAA